MIIFTIPIRTPNPLNGQHGHWAVAMRRHREQRGIVYLHAMAAIGRSGMARGGLLPCAVRVTRMAPSPGLDPHDALGASQKGVFDGVTDALGLKNDRDPRLSWALAQERAPAWGVRVEISTTSRERDALLAAPSSTTQHQQERIDMPKTKKIATKKTGLKTKSVKKNAPKIGRKVTKK